MSRKFAMVDPRIWLDPKFRRLDGDDQLAYMRLLTHRELNQFGTMTMTPTGIAAETNEPDRFIRGFDSLVESGFVLYDPDCCFIYLPGFLSKYPPINQNQVKSWQKIAETWPDSKLCRDLWEEIAVVYHNLRANLKAFGPDLANALLNKQLNNCFATVRKQLPEGSETLRQYVPVPVHAPAPVNEHALELELTDSTSSEKSKEKTNGAAMAISFPSPSHDKRTVTIPMNCHDHSRKLLTVADGRITCQAGNGCAYAQRLNEEWKASTERTVPRPSDEPDF